MNQKTISNRIPVTDFEAPELDIYARMNEIQLLNRHEPEKGMFIAESPKVIERAINSGYQPQSFLVDDEHMEADAYRILERCKEIPVYAASREVLRNLTGFPMTRGMLCAMHRLPLLRPETLLADARRVVILEHVVNPTNVGAIFRSAAALNMDAVLLCDNCSNPLYRRASRVSMGTVFQIPWTFIQDDKERRCDRKEIWPVQAIENLKALGYKTAALALTDDSVSIDDLQLMSEEKLAVILGTEGDGLMQETIKACDYTVKIPMSHGVDSLNVAAASAVAFWQLRK